jgi:hypothetical protein
VPRTGAGRRIIAQEQTFERYSEADVTADGRSPSAKLHERFIFAGCRRLMARI